ALAEPQTAPPRHKLGHVRAVLKRSFAVNDNALVVLQNDPPEWHLDVPQNVYLVEEARCFALLKHAAGLPLAVAQRDPPAVRPAVRSEERRVGKEGRSRWARYQYTQKYENYV